MSPIRALLFDIEMAQRLSKYEKAEMDTRPVNPTRHTSNIMHDPSLPDRLAKRQALREKKKNVRQSID